MYSSAKSTESEEGMNAPAQAHASVPVPARDRGKIAPAKLAHVVLRTANRAPMVAFYETVLEAQATFADANATFLTYDDEHHRIAVIELPGVGKPSRRRAGVDHIAFTYASLSDLLLTYKRLKGEGILPTWTTHHGATLSFYYADPDGNFCELQIDVFANAAALTAYFATDDFATNPVGVDVDADNLLVRFEAGEEEASLLVRHTDGPHDPRTMPRAYMGTFHWCMVRIAALLGLDRRRT